MKPLRMVLCPCVLMLLAPTAFAQRPPDPRVEVYIPNGMPIQIEVTRDQDERTITKYNIKLVVGPRVSKVTMARLLVGPDGRVRKETQFTTANLADPTSIAWASSVEVHRLIFIIKHLETDNGAWVTDREDINVRAIIERGAKALPRARFIARE